MRIGECFFIGLLMVTIASGGELGQELIPNGDMKQLDARGWPQGWPQGRLARIEQDALSNLLVCQGAHSGVYFDIPLKPEYGRLKLSMQMKVTDVGVGDETWKTGRLTMSFHDATGTRIGAWPDVFGLIGTKEWTSCERVYTIPEGAVLLKLSPCNLGVSGTVAFRHLSLTVSRLRALVPEDVPSPVEAGVKPESLEDAWRETTPTRERVCLNGLWRFRPVLTNEPAATVPPTGACWGWFKVPGIWPSGLWGEGHGVQQVWLAPWLEDRERIVDRDQAWYKRRITLPATWEKRRIALIFTMLQTHVQAYVDGQACGELWFPGGELDLTGHLKPGQEQELALLVTARPLSTEYNTFMAPNRIIKSKTWVRNKGITGDLFLCAMPSAERLEDVQVITSVKDQRISFVAETTGLTEKSYCLQAQVTGCGEATRSFKSGDLQPDEAGVLRFSAAWTDAKKWDIDTPQNRYSVELTLFQSSGKRLDTLTPITFGFREFALKGRDFLLNGTPIHLRVLYNAAANREANHASVSSVREQCRRMAEYGFNTIISGNYDFSPGAVGYLDGVLQACDESGMLLSVSLPHVKDFGYQMDTPEVAERYRQLAAWVIRRVRNHPAVVLYAMNHNATGYFGDQNPLKIDGKYEIPSVDRSDEKKPWWEKNRKQARVADSIAGMLDGTRPVYHHQSGHLGVMHTVNCYLNWAPLQERSDWTEHWAQKGVKPLFFVEWGLPHISSWSSYRGPQFIWRCEAFQSLWAAEFAAQFWGDAAYRDDATAVQALDHEERLWETGKPFAWAQLNQPLRQLTQNYHAVQAHFAHDNWRSFRAWGVSAMLPWDQGELWRRVEQTPPVVVKEALQGLKKPGIVPDRLPSSHDYLLDSGSAQAFMPSVTGKVFLRWNQPDCGFIGGEPSAFTAKDHLFEPNAEVHKQLVVINDRRHTQQVSWTWRLWQQGTKRLEQRGQITVGAGEQAFVPVTFRMPAQAADGEAFRLTAVFDFEEGVTQVDAFALQAIKAPAPPRLHHPVLLYDPHGLTKRLFDQLHVTYQVFDGTQQPRTTDLLVIGREALDGSAVTWLDQLPNGLRVLIFEQRAEVLESGLGFRIAERGERHLFSRYAHPVIQGLSAECFRDWSGSATLLSSYLTDLPQAETHDPLWQWCGFNNTRVWRCGNRGNVASVLIEKPARGDWRALVDGGFDLQYAALLEHVMGAGRVIFCQMDVTGRTTRDPVADRLVVNLLGYLDREESQAQRRVVCAGGRGCEDLLRDLGATPKPLETTTVYGKESVLVAGPGAPVPANLAQQIEKGLSVLCLGMSGAELRAWSPVLVTTIRTNACFKRIETLVPELNGLSNADWAWHGRMTYDALEIPKQEATSSNPAIRVIQHGSGRLVLWQVPPWMIDAQTKPYLRTSRRRANAMASRLLANLGAALDTPLLQRFAEVEEAEWLKSYYLDTPVAGDDPYRYYRW